MSGGAVTRFDRTWSLVEDPVSARTRAVDVATRHTAFVADGGRDVRVRVDRRGTVDVVSCTREVVTGARGVAATLVGRSMLLEQTEWWDDPDPDGVVTARLEVEFPHRPLHLDARIDVRPTATGSLHRVTGRARADLPGVGGLVTRRIVSQTLADLARHLPTPRG